MAKIVPLPDGSKLVKEEVSGPSSYTAGGFPVRMRELSVVTEVVRAKCDTGLLVEERIPAASGNLVSLRVYWPSGASGVPMVEVAEGTDLSAVKFTVWAIGY